MAIQLIDEFRFSHKLLTYNSALNANSSRGRMVNAFADRLYLSDGGAFLITGYRGVGKTTFVHDVINRLKTNLKAAKCSNHNQAPPPVLVDIYLNIARPLTGVELMHFILRQLHNRLADLKLLKQLPKPLRLQLRLAFLRTSAMLATSSSQKIESGISLEKWLNVSSKMTSGTSREINYLAYDERSAENDLVSLAQKLVKGFKPTGFKKIWPPFKPPTRLKLVFVFDELDKIDEAVGNESALTDILHALKTLFTTSGISFIFVAGRSLHERWQKDVQRGDSVLESVFSESRYLPAVWEQVDDICDPFIANQEGLTNYENQLYQDFKHYLAYTGRGIPRRILRGFYERVRWDGERASLALSERDRRQMRFHAELYQLLNDNEDLILGEQSRELLPDWLDKQRLGLYYILDWILSRGTHSFTLADLIDVATNKLKAGIAPTQELAPKVVAGLANVLCEHRYLEKFIDINETVLGQTGSEDQQEKYRLPVRRLIEMGRYREISESEHKAKEPLVLADRYQLIEPLGHGASARVYRALDRNTSHIVAVKYFNAKLFSANTQLQNELRREAEVQSQFQHTGIAKLLDVNFDNDTPFIVMEYLEGVTLHRMLTTQGALPVPEALSVMRSLLDTLHYLHNQGVIWRDVKPSNIMVTLEGRVVIVDFGTAQSIQSLSPNNKTNHTKFAIGTPAYMSPEQIKGEPQNQTSDLFSLGIILFEMLTGEKPWPVTNPKNLHQLLISKPVTQLPGFTKIPQKIRPVLLKALNIKPEKRYQSAQAMLEALPHSEPASELTARAKSAQQAPEELTLADIYVTQEIAIETPESESTPSKPKTQAIAPGPAPIPSASAAPFYNDNEELDLDMVADTTHQGMPILTIYEADTVRQFPLAGKTLTLGRSPECDIQLNDSSTSRFHASIIQENGEFQVEDLNSNNGLYVDGKRVYQQQKLEDGAQLRLGKTTIRFSAPKAPDTKKPASTNDPSHKIIV